MWVVWSARSLGNFATMGELYSTDGESANMDAVADVLISCRSKSVFGHNAVGVFWKLEEDC